MAGQEQKDAARQPQKHEPSVASESINTILHSYEDVRSSVKQPNSLFHARKAPERLVNQREAEKPRAQYLPDNSLEVKGISNISKPPASLQILQQTYKTERLCILSILQRLTEHGTAIPNESKVAALS